MANHRPNRATHATLPLAAHTDAPTRCAIAAYLAYTADPVMEPRPTLQQVRLVAQYCEEYIWSPDFAYVSPELAELRRRVEHICTLRELADWLWDCRAIGIEPL
jgi:hypothetical protein